MVIIKSPPQIEGIKKSSVLAAQTLEYVASFVKEGVSTAFLDQKAVEFISKNGAIAAPLNYNGFPKSICTSVNNVVCHGIPSEKDVLKAGDIINIDVTTILNGYYGDTSATYPVGEISPHAKQLIKATRDSMYLAIDALKPGKSLNASVGQVIEKYVNQFGFIPVRELGGHGVGIHFHEDPFVFHFTTPSHDTILKPGMIFTVEPMINASKNWQVTLDESDGWTIRTADGSLSAQFEHTILITEIGSEILTQI
ncbi:type I methionyl aminopeptidase [Candidatus Shapirobacteria bacterium]|nr:type I methionyl aminopeptidase [Candidatus Shapirobacteria bacterium]